MYFKHDGVHGDIVDKLHCCCYCCGMVSHKASHGLRPFLIFVYPHLSSNHSCFIRQTSLAVTSGDTYYPSKRTLARNSREFCIRILFSFCTVLQRAVKTHDIGKNGCNFLPGSFIALKNCPVPDLNPRTLSRIASTLTTRPPRAIRQVI